MHKATNKCAIDSGGFPTSNCNTDVIHKFAEECLEENSIEEAKNFLLTVSYLWLFKNILFVF